MSAKWLFTFKHFKFPLLPLLTHSALIIGRQLFPAVYNFWTGIFVELVRAQKTVDKSEILCVVLPSC